MHSVAVEKLAHWASLNFESKETWEQMWTTDKPEFHCDEVNTMLMKQHREFTRGRKNLRILVPLCGKSLDMMWLADQGHSVVGVELLRKGIEAFFCDNKLTHREEPIKLRPGVQGTVFKANEKDISLVECSIFDFCPEAVGGQFDCIWDRGSIPCINMMKEGRLNQYIDLMLACLKPDGRYFLAFLAPESVEGIPSKFKFITEENLTELFRERCTIQFLGKDKIPEESRESEERREASKSEVPGDSKPGVIVSIHYYFVNFKKANLCKDS